MNSKIRYIAQLFNEEIDEILEERLLQTEALQFPDSFQEFSLDYVHIIL